jgi:hypothetical protein
VVFVLQDEIIWNLEAIKNCTKNTTLLDRESAKHEYERISAKPEYQPTQQNKREMDIP